jgi:signal transduction histidine kinase
MRYDGSMQEIRSPLDSNKLIRVAALLWLVYLGALAIVDYTIQAPHPRVPEYYIGNAVLALACLGLSYWYWLQSRLRRTFIPMMIVIIAAVPVVLNYTLRIPAPPSPFTSPESMAYRVLPFLFIALILVAWQYRWQHILLFSLGSAVLSLGIMLPLTNPRMIGFEGALFIVVIQTASFLTIGFFINLLMHQLRRQQHSLEEANLGLQHYANTLEHLTVSRERNRMARELHDTLAHTLSGLSVELETVKAYLDVDDQKARALLEESLAVTRSGLKETRRAIKALRATPLDDLGLQLGIRQVAEEAEVRGGLTLDLKIADELPALSPDVEQCVYRIAQEAVSNVITHAGASKLSITLQFNAGWITLTVIDDGVGFNPKKNRAERHYGLTGMQERSRLIGGDLEVTSHPGEGTSIRLAVPWGGQE